MHLFRSLEVKQKQEAFRFFFFFGAYVAPIDFISHRVNSIACGKTVVVQYVIRKNNIFICISAKERVRSSRVIFYAFLSLICT